MAAFDHFSNMYDVAVKPRLLRSLVREHIPDEKHPFSNPSELSRVISMVKTHSLLAESFTESMDPKKIESWKFAVDSWVDRILTLASSDTPDKCWAGVSLLGFTCQECSSARFLKSYSGWFQKLLHFLQSPGVSHFVRVASLASISDLFSRLSGFPNIKKDGSSFAVKAVQPVLKLLNDDNSEDIWEGALQLLCTIMTSFPFSVHRNYDTVESAVASKLLSGGCSQYLLKKLAYCLALLPKLKGDEESWSMMMQKILVVINDQLNNAFQGLEEETKCYEFTKMLVQPGKVPPPALGGYIPAEEASYKATKRSTKQSPISNVSALMLCCCTMLTNLYSFKVNVPVRLLLALVDRVLMVNGSLPQISLPFITAKHQEDICSELPVLHSYSLELLTAVIKGVGSQLLPHAAFTMRIITMYFRTCASPELRIKVYSVTRILLTSMGVGLALCLAQEVINNAFVDLSTTRNKSCGTLRFSNSNAPTEALLPCRRKRKHGSTIGSLQLQGHDEVSGLEEASKNHLVTPICLRIAALEALEALITVAGGLRSEKWRSKVDDLLIVIAIDSFEGWANEEVTMFGRKESAATSADLQLAALRALLASFLSFSQARPPHLAQGLELFRRGKQLIGTKLAEFCAHALLALEVLIHPRALPLVDYSSANHNSFHESHRNFEDGYALGQNKSTPYGLQQVVHDAPESDDDLCHRWLENEEEPDVPLAEGAKHDEGPSSTLRDNDHKLLTVHNSSGTQKPEEREQVPEIATCTDIEMRVVEDEIIGKSDQPGGRESIVQFQEPISCRSISVAEASCGYVPPENTMPHNTGIQVESGQGDSSKDKEFALKLNDDDSSADEDAFPDIVDADPDSDSN